MAYFQTAFQRGAFQTNAFQIYDTNDGGGGGGHHVPYRRRRHAAKLRNEYKAVVKESPENASEFITAVDPYVQAITDEEKERRKQIKPAMSVAPPAERIDFIGMYDNLVARQRFIDTMLRIKERLLKQRIQEQNAIILMMMLDG